MAPITWTELLASAEVIVRAEVVSVAAGPFGSGSADLSVQRVLRGQVEDGGLRIAWGSEVHDQRVSCLGATYLLFLRRDPETQALVASSYGRSYWLIERSVSDDGPVDIVRFTYPVTLVALPSELVVEMRHPVILSGPARNFEERYLAVPLGVLETAVLAATTVPVGAADRQPPRRPPSRPPPVAAPSRAPVGEDAWRRMSMSLEPKRSARALELP